ncbi:unnamed protein product [Acanthoscelides obtectus]|uniref:Uncharacterized protein n=1 Tax=Acanthoscelides obtectus TaxID=200917 RepID=A0A9P0JP15_ACAOB|nr:unnamed protein product [Acanthoscelides obtectus]CAK1641309.1 hypothetical protein AOBTE_LOCUS12320 [Acanthoscelides obtectus]
MRSMGRQYQSASPGSASPASFYSSSTEPQYKPTFPELASPASLHSSSSDEAFHTTPTITSLRLNSSTSSVHQPSIAPVIPTTTCNDMSILTENNTNL